MFYPNKIKIIPDNIYDLLTPVALAHLIMGDGYYHPVNGGLLICTDSYSIKDVVKLMNVLVIRYNFTCSIRQHNKGQYRVSIHKQSIKSLATIVKPYMDPSFYYKIGLNVQPNTISSSLIKGRIGQLSNVRRFSTSALQSKYVMSSFSTLCEDFTYKKNFASYLAGLIDALGSIAVHNKDSNAKKYHPKIIVVFSSADEPLANKLASITKAGAVYVKKNAGCVLWQIQKTEDVIKIINIINGYMRTPKIEALHRAIKWFNEFYNYSIDCLGLDLSPIDSNAWLAGFTDGDGNFSITLTNRKKKGNITSKRVQAFFRLELRQTYHRDVTVEQGGTSYFVILSKIATYLGVNLYSRTREQNDKVFYAFMVISHSAASHAKVISYFDRFPLYSSKYLAYKDWSYVVEQAKLRAGKVLTPKEISEVETIKAQFNSKRKSFDFSHLDSLA
jgi:hypothetical protein